MHHLESYPPARRGNEAARQEAESEFMRLQAEMRESADEIRDLESDAAGLGINLADAYNSDLLNNTTKAGLHDYFSRERMKWFMLLDKIDEDLNAKEREYGFTRAA